VTADAALIAIALLTLVNVGLVGLSLKLYTEYFKDRAISRRQP
jgi:hypothetical protein